MSVPLDTRKVTQDVSVERTVVPGALLLGVGWEQEPARTRVIPGGQLSRKHQEA